MWSISAYYYLKFSNLINEMKKVFTLLAITLWSMVTVAQDTSSIMYYNLLNFPETNPGRMNDLKTIFQTFKPDLYSLAPIDCLGSCRPHCITLFCDAAAALSVRNMRGSEGALIIDWVIFMASCVIKRFV